MSGLKIFLLSFIILFTFGFAIAQEEAPAVEVSPEVIEMINLDENIQPEDLEIKEPSLLPDSPFYFLKNWARGVRLFFTFDPVRKVDLRLKFADEKIVEAKKLAEKKASSEKIKKAIENYEKEIEKIKERSEKFEIKAKEKPDLDKFLDKYVAHQALHHRLLQKLETQVPPEAIEKIKEARERHLERFKEVMTKLEEADKIPERIEKNLKKIKGSEFKQIKDLEILKELEEKFPEEIKEKMKERQEKMIEEMHKKLEKMSAKAKERFEDYLEGMSGDKLTQLDLITDLEGEELSEEMQELMEKVRKKKLEQIEKATEITAEKAKEQIAKAETELAKAEEVAAKMDSEVYKAKAALRLLEVAKDHLAKAKIAYEEGKYGRAFGLATSAYHQALAVQRIGGKIEEWKESPEKMKEKFEELYPQVPLPEDITQCKLIAPPKCPKGKVVMEITPMGCPIFRCEELPAQPVLPEVSCYTLWDPVCGVDGITYPNDCVAEEIAGVKIAHKGVCKGTIRKPLEKIEKLEIEEELTP